jgi:hypothetical protein
MLRCERPKKSIRAVAGKDTTKRHASRKRTGGTLRERTEEDTVAHKSAHFATGINREPLAQDELEPVWFLFVWFLLPVEGGTTDGTPFKDRVCTEIVRDKVGRFEQEIHVGRRRALQR